MYQTYTKNGYTVMHYQFYSLEEYISFLAENPIRIDIFKDPRSISTNLETQTNSLQEAMDLCKYGNTQGYHTLIKLKRQLERHIKMTFAQNKQYNDYIGYAPDVKAYLEGNPLSMLNKKNIPKKKVTIYLNSTYCSNDQTSAIFNRGAIVLTLIEMLENLGYIVDFHLFIMAEQEKQLLFSEFFLKKETERINPQKLYFPLCHPSWIRRLFFRLIEATKDVTSKWANDYGSQSKIWTLKEIIEPKPNDIIIPTIGELNIYGYDIINDANSLLDYLKLSSNKEFGLERIKKNNKKINI